ncbi:hypothetical protein ABPG77_007437 [Micractinium sp. CCAP 211/92]
MLDVERFHEELAAKARRGPDPSQYNGEGPGEALWCLGGGTSSERWAPCCCGQGEEHCSQRVPDCFVALCPGCHGGCSILRSLVNCPHGMQFHLPAAAAHPALADFSMADVERFCEECAKDRAVRRK